jgi:hypothetical protein
LVTSGRDVSAAPTGGSFFVGVTKGFGGIETDWSPKGGARLAAKSEKNV